MRLVIKRFNVNTGGPLVAVLNKQDAAKLDLYAQDRIKIKRLRSNKTFVVVADISNKGIKEGEIGLLEEAFERVGVPDGTEVDVDISDLPDSLGYIHSKLDGAKLTKGQIDELVRDIVDNKISTVELTYFVAGCYAKGFDLEESADLTNAIVNTGDKLKFDNKIVLDKHCLGGVPGNRTTMIVVPIIAAAGFLIPKTSSRAITSAAGTADTMEVLAPVNLAMDKIKRALKKTNACIAWGGTMHLAGADELLIRVRHPLSIDPEGMMLASIIAKKKAVGATHVLIDIPFGRNAKVPTLNKARNLKKKFEKIGHMVGLNVHVVLTNGSQPIGKGIGPALEVRDVLSVLHGDGPSDLMEKSVFLASEMLSMVGVKDARSKVLEILQSGKAFRKFREIVSAQGGSRKLAVPRSKFFFAVNSPKDGVVKLLHNRYLVRVARVAGAPSDKVAGIYLNVKQGAKVRKGSNLFFIHAQSKAKLDSAVKLSRSLVPVVVV